jgi:hypothetical protein
MVSISLQVHGDAVVSFGNGRGNGPGMGLWSKGDDMLVHRREPFNAEPPRRALALPRVSSRSTTTDVK